MTHTSGIPRMGKLDYYSRPDHDVTEKELLDGLKGLALDFVPGTKSVYSNLAVGVAGIVVGRASGLPYREFVTQRILKPLGMTSTFWDQSAVPTERLATGYQLVKGEHKKHPHWRFGASEALGGLYTTATDMARYVGFQLSAWPPSSGPERKPARRATVRESQLIAGYGRPDMQTYGANWAPMKVPKLGFVVAHTGGTFAYVANVSMAPQAGLGVVLMTNMGDQTLKSISTISGLGIKVLTLLAKHDPKVKVVVTPQLEGAIKWVQQQLHKPDRDAIEQRFDEVMKKVATVDRLVEIFTKAGVGLGPCSSYEPVKKKGKHGVVVNLQCEKGKAQLMVHVGPGPEYLLNGFSIYDIDSD